MHHLSVGCHTPGTLPILPLMDSYTKAAPSHFIKSNDSRAGHLNVTAWRLLKQLVL